MRSFFNFTKRTDDLGVGTSDRGLLPFQTLPAGGSYLGGTGRREWNVRRQLGPLNAPGFMILNKGVVPIPLSGNGLGISGQYVLQSLVKQEKQK